MPPDFKAFDWVNPDAPKGGRVRQFAQGTFDSLNQFPIQGQAAAGIGLIRDRLFAASPDEASTAYAAIAEWVSYPDDFSSAAGLREGARFHDGRAITPDDVIFSMEALKKASPNYSTYYQHVTAVEKTGQGEVTFKFDVKDNRELPRSLARCRFCQALVGREATRARRATSRSRRWKCHWDGRVSRPEAFEPGRSITYERVKDWWAQRSSCRRGPVQFRRTSHCLFP